MRDLLLVLTGTGIKPKPASPITFQSIPCPNGMGGTWEQVRSCTWNVSAQAWECTPWQTAVYSCTPLLFVFVTNLQRYSPAYKGRCNIFDEGMDARSQDYIPPPVYQNGYRMDLSSTIECQGGVGSQHHLLTIQITKDGIPASGTVSVVWDRDYASFANKTLNGAGIATWDELNDQFVENPSRFTVTFTPA